MYAQHSSHQKHRRSAAGLTAALFFCAALAASQLHAGMIAFVGDAVNGNPPPASVEEGQLESNLTVPVFAERKIVPLASDLTVDIVADGTYGTPLSPGVVPQGTVVNSYLVHADTVADGSPTIVLSGGVRFNEEILGLIITDSSLDASDDELGYSGTVYPTGLNLRGLNTAAADTVRLDGHDVSFVLPVHGVTDQIRIITAEKNPDEPVFRRGDANVDGNQDVGDPVYLLDWAFFGGPEPRCKDAADANDSGDLNVTDVLFLLLWHFLGAPAPPPPGPEDCGPDPGRADLTCESYDVCL